MSKLIVRNESGFTLTATIDSELNWSIDPKDATAVKFLVMIQTLSDRIDREYSPAKGDRIAWLTSEVADAIGADIEVDSVKIPDLVY